MGQKFRVWICDGPPSTAHSSIGLPSICLNISSETTGPSEDNFHTEHKLDVRSFIPKYNYGPAHITKIAEVKSHKKSSLEPKGK